MKKELINEINRIKELSSINEEKQIINEGDIITLIQKIIHFFEIASDEVKNSEVGKKLQCLLDKLKKGESPLSCVSISDSEKDSSVSTETKPINDEAKSLSSVDDETYKKILEGIGATWNDVTKLLMYSWRRAESGAEGVKGSLGCRNNPFNTTYKQNLRTEICGKHGEKHYESIQDGIEATIKTLEYGKIKYNYQEIIDALKNSDADAFFDALKNSSWGTNADLVKTIYNDYLAGVSFKKPRPIA